MLQQVQCAAILAGGKSSRMGREKALMLRDGQPFITNVAALLHPIFPQICVVTADAEVARAAQLPAIGDRFPGRGPLAGIHAALQHFQAPTFVVACDMPFLNAEFIAFLGQNFQGDALVPRSENGFEPLHAIYSPLCLSVFESFLDSGEKMPSMRRVLEQIDTRFVPPETARGFDPDLKCFSNWNTPEDLLLA